MTEGKSGHCLFQNRPLGGSQTRPAPQFSGHRPEIGFVSYISSDILTVINVLACQDVIVDNGFEG
jgi:hypothetical protein